MELEQTKEVRNQSKNGILSQQAVEVPSIRLLPEQIEEIHADEYSLTLFYATRVEPLTLNEIKRNFAEPEPKKAQSVIDRFLKVGLVHITPEGSYYSNYPEHYINYSHYRYDGDLEARKDAKVFQLMKEFSGKPEYWKDKTYFSMDAFYSKAQTDELIEMLKEFKQKAKAYADENAKKKSIKGLKFRRMKFYDMTFSLIFGLILLLGMNPNSFAGGNDPVVKMGAMYERVAGGGNDPTELMIKVTNQVPPRNFADGGGGHDPDGNRDPKYKGTNISAKGADLGEEITKVCEGGTLIECEEFLNDIKAYFFNRKPESN